MVSDLGALFMEMGTGVLIIVLVEYGLWHYRIYYDHDFCNVLILVLMEYGLWPIKEANEANKDNAS